MYLKATLLGDDLEVRRICICVTLLFMLSAALPSTGIATTGSTVLFNDTDSEVYGLRVIFDQPVTITQMGMAFSSWVAEEDGSIITFGNGSLEVWEDFYFNWEPEEASLVSHEWLLEAPALEIPSPITHWGFTLPEIWGGGYRHHQVFDSLDGLISTGANSVTLAPQLVMETSTSSRITTTNESITQQLADMRDVIEYLRNANLSVFIKPKLLPRDGTWSAKISPEDPYLWFQNYKEILLKYAKLAEETGVQTLFLTNELESMVVNPDYTDEWIDIIESIREVFSGNISLNSIINNPKGPAASEVMHIPFADRLDFIGVSMYLSLTGKNDPTVDELVNAWYGNRKGVNIVEALKSIYRQYKKPVIISEIAYKWIDGANRKPWRMTGAVDYQEQRDLFDALMQVLTREGPRWVEEWLRGVSIWAWFTYPNPELVYLSDFVFTSVQSKPAEELLTEWFHRFRQTAE